MVEYLNGLLKAQVVQRQETGDLKSLQCRFESGPGHYWGHEFVMEYELQKLTDRIGVNLSQRDASDSYHYDGKSIALQSRGIKISNTRVLHEILHFAVATEKQRQIPNYGLGKSSYDSPAAGSPIVVPFDDVQSQEFLVVMLTRRCRDLMPYNFGANLDRWIKNHSDLLRKNEKRYFDIVLKYRLNSRWW